MGWGSTRRYALAVVALGAGVWAIPTVAAAHVQLTSPPPRYGKTQSPGPCGSGPVVGERTTFMAGETITVAWTQEIPHGGYYFVRFSPNDDAGFDDNELLMLDEVESQTDYAVEVTLPACSCTDCTLQLWQAQPSLNGGYYACADIELVSSDALSMPPCPEAMVEPTDPTAGGDGSGDGGSADGGSDDGSAPADGGNADDGSAPATSSGGGATADDGAIDDADGGGSDGGAAEGGAGSGSGSGSDGGCAVGPRPAGALGWWSLLLPLGAVTRRRRSR